MPVYQHVLLLRPRFDGKYLADFFKRHAKKAIENGAVFRTIENHGFRALPERTRLKFIASSGERYFWEARYVTTVVDASPKQLIEIERSLRLEESVIRFHTLKLKSAISYADGKTFRNRYYERIRPLAEPSEILKSKNGAISRPY